MGRMASWKDGEKGEEGHSCPAVGVLCDPPMALGPQADPPCWFHCSEVLLKADGAGTRSCGL